MKDHLGNKIGIDENDLWIVALAAERNLTLITHDRMRRIRDVVQQDVRIVIVSAI
jgi:predicted nucleic acid-binding protein